MILVVAWSVAQMKPVMDTDLWFHMAYGRQMLENRSLILDHTAFSWTATDGSLIYCAWLMQLLLYGLYSIGGLPLLFVFSYLVFGAFLLLLLLHARSLGVVRHPLTSFAALLALLMFAPNAIIKPNIVSFLFMAVTAWTWLRIRRGDARAWRWCYLLPLVMLVWVNSHGGYLVGLGFLGIMGVGEVLNGRLSPALALPQRTRKHLWIALGLCGLAFLATPYGWHYPFQFLTFVPDKEAIKTVREYDSIFARDQLPKHYIDYAVIGFVLFVGLLIPAVYRRQVDWALILVNLVFAALYVAFVRLTIFWAPILALTIVSLIGARPAWVFPRTAGMARTLGVVILLSGAMLGGRMAWSSLVAPDMGSWLGFGNAYWNPEEEAEYIGEHFRDARICNDYNSGAYLLWKLGPRTKVYIDARAFPYFSWFAEYRALETTVGIDALLKKYPCDVALIELALGKSIAWFKQSPQWVPAFYGASSAVFVKKGTPLPGGGIQSGREIGDVRNLVQGLLVLAFALDSRDIAGAERVVAGMRERFTYTAQQRQLVGNAGAVLDGVRAYLNHDYETAIKNLKVAVGTFSGSPSDMLSESATHLMSRAWADNDIRQALELSALAMQYAPNDPIPRYNAGVLKWWLRGEVGGVANAAGATSWRQDLEAFLKLLPNRKDVHPRAIEVVQAILQGKAEGRPPLVVPDAPKLPAGSR